MSDLRIKRVFSRDGVETALDGECKHPINPNAGLYVKYDGEVWTWVVYNSGPTPYDYTLTYTLAKTVPKDELVLDLDSAEFIPQFNDSCECGAEKVGHPSHSVWCPKSNQIFLD